MCPMPKPQGIQTPLTYGELRGLAVPRGNKNYTGAVAVAQLLSSDAAIVAVSSAMNLPPVRRDLIKDVPNDASQTAFMHSALIARGWLDPSPKETNGIFESMVEWVLSGKYGPTEAVNNAALSMQRLFQ